MHSQTFIFLTFHFYQHLLAISGLSSHLVKSRFSHISSFFGFVQFVLDLSVFGQVLVGNFFSFFGLSFVSLDLDLQFVDEILDSSQVLFVFVGLVGDFLDLSFQFSGSLDTVSSSSLFRVQFVFEFSNSSFHLLDLLSATLKSNLFGFVQSVLEVLDIAFHVLLHSFQVRGLVLFLLQFFGHHSGVSDSLLGLVFGVSAFGNQFFDFALRLGDFSFELTLLVDQSSVLSVQQVGSFVGFIQFGFSQFSGSFGLFNRVSEFFDFASQQSRSSFNNSHLFSHVVASSVSFIKFGLGVLDLGLQGLNVLDGISGLSVGMTKLDFQVVKVRLQLLLLSDSFSSGF